MLCICYHLVDRLISLSLPTITVSKSGPRPLREPAADNVAYLLPSSLGLFPGLKKDVEMTWEAE